MSNTEKYITTELSSLVKLEYLAHGGSLLPKRLVHSVLAGKNSSKLRGRGLDFEEVRKYAHGDDIRNIDWRVTARTKIPHTKVFNEEKERPVFSIVDQSSYMFFGSKLYTKSVIAAEAVAISAFRTLKAGDRFGGIVFSDESYEHIVPKRSRISVMRYLETVVNYNQQLPTRARVHSNAQRLSETLKRAQMAITHDYVVVVISDFNELNEEIVQHLIKISMHNDVILVNVNDPLDQQLPKSKIVLTDGDYQISWDGDRSDLQADYLHNYNVNQKVLNEQLRKYGIVNMTLDTQTSVSEQLASIFGKLST